jgi:predicted DNA-binding transcriptional regulator AlpA
MLKLEMAPRRGLSREEAARYVGISPATFDKLRNEHKMPPPRTIGTRKLWDVRELDVAFDDLPRENAPATGDSSWEDY